MSDIWARCATQARPGVLAGDMVRVVESQEQVATLSLVDTLEEQALLEDLLEGAKPRARAVTRGLHYLLATPFRYPPLRHGSRFGARHEPSLFYGSRGVDTALAETAYYRFVFWYGMRSPPPDGRLVTQHTVFGARYRTAQGLRLQEPPFAAFEQQLTDPLSYTATQQLGGAMRGHGVEAFEFRSARDRGRGLNVALFAPGALARRQPISQQAWIADARDNQVSFSGPAGEPVRHFPLDDFQVAGRLPRPAT